MYSEITACRICKNTQLTSIINFGKIPLTGLFLGFDEAKLIPTAPLELVYCAGNSEENCGLVQLRHDYALSELFGHTYGYRSGLNADMVAHLKFNIESVLDRINLDENDVVVDIGSNDGTSLGFYPDSLVRIGVDPTIEKFGHYYHPGIVKISDFFTAAATKPFLDNRSAKIVTCFSMFYDLPNPESFLSEVVKILDPHNGILVLEQSYLKTMIEKSSFDTICHEHIEYYSLRQIEWLAKKVNLRIIDVNLNSTNGGSFCVYLTGIDSNLSPVTENITEFMSKEKYLKEHQDLIYTEFSEKCYKIKDSITLLLSEISKSGKKVYGLGASTKGNTLLNFCGISTEQIQLIGEVNSDKFGKVTPGTFIPIVDEREIFELSPDYLFVLPWHFKDFFLTLEHLGRFQKIFPLPELEIIQ